MSEFFHSLRVIYNVANSAAAALSVLVATIRDLGNCPCPLCLVTLDQIALLGQVTDERTRSSKRRMDTAERVGKVTSARKIIYQKGYAPGNDHSDHFLKPESLVATEVGSNFQNAATVNVDCSLSRMRSQRLSAKNLVSITLVYLLLISCMNLSSECGSRCLRISFGCFTRLAKTLSTNLTAGKLPLFPSCAPRY